MHSPQPIVPLVVGLEQSIWPLHSCCEYIQEILLGHSPQHVGVPSLGQRSVSTGRTNPRYIWPIWLPTFP